MRSASSHPWIKLSLLSTLLVLLVGVRPAAPASANFGYVAVAAGDDHSCALTSSGGVRCWGNNQYGQLGDGTSGDYDYNRPYPADVAGLTSGVVKVQAGMAFTCALLETGGVKCWGQNGSGQLGDGTSIDRTTPADVLGLTSGVTDIATASGPDACAIKEDTTLWCWGQNYLGQLGNGTAQIPNPPYFNAVPGPVCADATCTGPLTGVAAMALGALEACALVEEDVQTPGYGVKCWGGTDSIIDPSSGCGSEPGVHCETTPKDVEFFTSGVSLLANAEGRRCAVMTSATVTCWGLWASSPYNISGLSAGVTKLDGGGDRMCAILSTSALKCWGSAFIGNGTPNISASPAAVCADAVCSGPYMNAVDVSLGSYYHSCAVNAAGFVKCWGYNFRGQVGDGTVTPFDEPRLAPVDLQQDTDEDGCIDSREVQNAANSELLGGRRSAKNSYDYFNPSHDGKNRIDDVLAVVDAYFIDVGNPAYNADTDRTFVGPNAWDLGPPDGKQRIDDVVNIVKQYYHDCS